MNINPRNIFDYKDGQLATKHGYLTFRLYSDGWLVRFTPNAGETITVEGQDVWAACAFANYHIGQ